MPDAEWRGTHATLAAMTLSIEHQARQHRFSAVVDRHECVLDYELADGVMTIVHTGVDPSLEGRGIAGALVQAALAHAKDEGFKVRPACSYAKAYMQRHPETKTLLA